MSERMSDGEFLAIECMVGDMDDLSLGAQARLCREAGRARASEAKQAKLIELMLDWIEAADDPIRETPCTATSLLREGGRDV